MAVGDNLQQEQNSVEIHYVTTQGAQLLEPIRLSQLIGEQFQITPPIIDGFVLVERPEELIQIMTSSATQVELVYAKLGRLHVYHSLADITGELIPLQNGQTADSAAPVRLQPIPAHSYYILTDDGLGEPVSDADHFQPIRADATTKLISLTEEERQQMMDLEESLTLEVAEALAGQPIPQQPKPKPLPESTQPAQPQPPATYPGQLPSSIDTPISPLSRPSQTTQSNANPPERFQANPVQANSVQMKPPEPEPNAQLTQPVTEINSISAISQGHTVEALARAVAVISRGLAQTSPQNKPAITELTQSAIRLIQAIRKLE